MDTVEVAGIPIGVVEHGEGTPLLLIHGWQGDHRYMQADLEPIFDQGGPTDGWRRIYVDVPGHGSTPAPDWLESYADVISVLADFARTVFGEEPFALVGSSWGGYNALALVRSMPERLLGAALLVPWLPDANGVSDVPEHRVLVADPDAFADLAPDEEWMPDILVEHSRAAVEQIRRYDMPSIRAADQAALARLEASNPLAPPMDRPGAPFDRPSLIVTARQDATVGYRAGFGLTDEFPRATYAILDLAGHWLGRIERPEPFRALFRDWLARLRIDASV